MGTQNFYRNKSGQFIVASVLLAVLFFQAVVRYILEVGKQVSKEIAYSVTFSAESTQSRDLGPFLVYQDTRGIFVGADLTCTRT
jgi:hypothetical protein